MAYLNPSLAGEPTEPMRQFPPNKACHDMIWTILRGWFSVSLIHMPVESGTTVQNILFSMLFWLLSWTQRFL